MPSMQRPGATTPLCLWQFFESTVTKSKGPGEHKVALSDDEGNEMTFEQLQTMSEELDIWMRRLGCGKDTRVMLVNSISVWAFVAVMAVIRNGAIIIPNDYKDPAEYRAVRSALWLPCLPRRRNRNPGRAPSLTQVLVLHAGADRDGQRHARAVREPCRRPA